MGEGGRRILRVIGISAVLFAAFLLLEPYGLGWLVVPAGLLVAVVLVALAWVYGRRARKRYESLEQDLDLADPEGEKKERDRE